jgi:hypothetical protein
MAADLEEVDGAWTAIVAFADEDFDACEGLAEVNEYASDLEEIESDEFMGWSRSGNSQDGDMLSISESSVEEIFMPTYICEKLVITAAEGIVGIKSKCCATWDMPWGLKLSELTMTLPLLTSRKELSVKMRL